MSKRVGLAVIEVLVVLGVAAFCAMLGYFCWVDVENQRIFSKYTPAEVALGIPSIREIPWRGHEYLSFGNDGRAVLHSESCPCHRSVLENSDGGVRILYSTTNFSKWWISNTTYEVKP